MSLRIGQDYEAIAQRYLKKEGLKPVAQNFRTRMGEIDLIMQDTQELVFVEVKYRRSNQFGGSIYAISRGKRQRLVRTAEAYLKMKKGSDTIPARFDVVAIEPDGIRWIKNAFWAQ